MAEVRTDEFLLDVARGNIKDAFIVHKFGANNKIKDVMEPLALDGVYRTPTTPQTLEIVSNSVLDIAGGAGARSVMVSGIGPTWELQDEEVKMNGTRAVTLTKQFLRVFRVEVHTSGTYATATTGSHAGDIEVSDGSDVWASISLARDNFPLGSSEIGCYTVPLGYEAVLLDRRFYLEAGNARVTAALFHRGECNVITEPYSPMTILDIYREIGERDVKIDGWGRSKKFTGPCDIGFMAIKEGSGFFRMSVGFDLLLLKI